ncbi:MAG: hypothetical protein ACFE96_18705, partial [Candidatus Hermodarchaeota archaeon]
MNSKKTSMVIIFGIILSFLPINSFLVSNGDLDNEASKELKTSGEDQLILVHSYDFEEDVIGQDPIGITLSVNDPVDSGSVNIDNLGDVQQNHVALHKSGGSKLIQLMDNLSYYQNEYNAGELHFKFYHDNSLFGLHMRDSDNPGSQGILLGIDFWDGFIGRYGVTTYTNYALNQWVNFTIYYDISKGWMFKIDGVFYGEGYSYSFEHDNPSGIDYIQWRSAYSGGGNGYLRIDDIAFYYDPEIIGDITPPLITIEYRDGDGTIENPGKWNVLAYDYESGINEDTITILIDGVFAGNT